MVVLFAILALSIQQDMETIRRILLTGASGTVGQEVLQQLAGQPNIQLTVFDIANARSQKLFEKYGERIRVIYGDISNEEEVKLLPTGFDVVIHLAAIIPPLADQFPELTRKVNVSGTKNLVEHIQTTSPDAFFLYSSSVSVYGDRVETPFIRATDRLHISDGDVYGQTKMDAEKIVQSSSLDWSVFRLAAIMKNHKISKLMFHMPLDTMLEICTPEDTAAAFVKAVFARDQLKSRIFNLGGGENCCLSYRDFLQRSFHIFGLGKLNFPAHAFAERNFHCGMMADGNLLEDMLLFRHDDIETYFRRTAKTVSPMLKILAVVFRPFVKWYLLLQSEPYKAYVTKNAGQIRHFFKSPGMPAYKL